MSNYRSPIRVIRSDFKAGEVDPRFAMRVDSGAYISGASKLTNMLLHGTGAAERRPGTILMNGLPMRTRLVGFEFDADEKYIIGFQNNQLQVFDPSGAIVQTLAAPWFSGTPEAPGAAWKLNTVQKGDVMIIVYPNFKPMQLRRTSASTFTLTYIQFSSDTADNVLNQPYMKYGAATVTVGISDWTIGAGRTLTSNTAIFSSDWVGDRIRIYNCEMLVTAYVNSTTVTVTVLQEIRKRLDPAPFRYDDSTTTVEVTHALHGLTTGATVNISGASDFDTVLESEMNGNRVITVVDEDRYTVVCGGTPPDISGDGGGPAVFIKSTAQTRDWTEPVWSDRRGWPGAVCLHENRIWLGGSTSAPTFLAGSVIGAYYDFNVGDGFADESVQGNISALSRIRHLLSAHNMQIFCEAGEAVVEVPQGEPITPGTLKVVTNTAYGSNDASPALFDGATLFVQRNGKTVREFLYDYNSDTWAAPPVSGLANHMIADAYQIAVLPGTSTRPELYAFFVNRNGTIACFHSLRSEKLIAWTRFDCGGNGTYDSVCVIGSSVYFVVKREGIHYLEQLVLDRNDIWLDSVQFLSAGSPQTVWTLNARFANDTVQVMSGGHYLGTYVADATPQITLLTAVTDIIVGYDYGVELTPLPPDKELNDGGMTGEIRRIVSATVHFHNSVSGAVNGLEQLGFTIGQDPSLPPAQISTKKRVRLLGYGRDPTVTITQPAPGPMMVLGLSTEVSL